MEKPLALIVEDDQMLADIFARMLNGIDYRTEIVRDGQVASAWLSEFIPDLLVLDLHLPYLSGEEILKQVKNDKRFIATRIMIISADAAMASYLSDQVTMSLIKPVDVVAVQKLAGRLKPQTIRQGLHPS
jgi:DNA-binding response OmpR family regulator